MVAFGGLALGVLGYTAAGFGGTTTAPAGSDSAAGTTLLTKYFPQSAANPTTPIFKFSQPVWTDPQVLAKTTTELRASRLFTQVAGPLSPTGAALPPADYAALHAGLGPAGALPPTPPTTGRRPRSRAGTTSCTGPRPTSSAPTGGRCSTRSGLKAGDPGGTPALNAVPAIRAEISKVAASVGATDSGVGGEAPALYDISAVSNSDLAQVIPIAIVAIGILLALVLRSLVAPLYLIASVGLSYLAALGLSVLLFIKIGGDQGLVFFLPFLMFIFLLALGEDYNILVMTRIREEAHRLPLREAVTKAISVTGTTVTSAGLVLAGTFIVFGLVAGGQSGGSQFRDIALGLALGILMDTFLVRTLLVPSTVVLLGRWNWWPSKVNVDQAGPPAGPAATAAPGRPGRGPGSPRPRRPRRRRPSCPDRPPPVPGPPLISVIIPVYDVAAYLPECLDSVLGPGGDVEVIAVDDASPDGCGALLAERAAADPRLHVVSLAVNGGPGAARNAGLARGRRRVRLVRRRRRPTGRRRPGRRHRGPAAAARTCCSSAGTPPSTARPGGRARLGCRAGRGGRAQELSLVPAATSWPGCPRRAAPWKAQPGLIDLSMTSWSKLLRREFLAKLGVTFGPGIHEDVIVTCAALLAAESVGAVARPCYRYRRDRRGQFMGTAGPGHLGIFEAYGQVFELVDARAAAGTPASAAVRAAIFERAIWHYTTVFQATGAWPGRGSLVPRAARRAFFARMHADFMARAGRPATAGRRARAA